MPVTYVRGDDGKFIQVGPGGATTDTTLSLAGKPADAAAVGNAMSMKANKEYVDSNIAYLSNPNLLINSDFRNPVNQRGNTSYSYSGSSVTYTIDRWCINYNSTITVNSGYVTLTGNTATNNYWNHVLEHSLSGTFTLSVSIKNTSGGTGYVFASNNNGDTERMTLTNGVHSITFNMDGLCKVGFCSLKTGMKSDVEWVKLEYGNRATPFIPRQYAEELMLCQRYHRRVYKTPIIGSSSTSTTYMLPLQFNPPMMDGYTVTLKEVFNSSGASQSGITLSSCAGGIYNTQSLQLSKTIGQFGFVTLVFDAEIYNV